MRCWADCARTCRTVERTCHVHAVGCNSKCWAQAAANVMESRLCIATDGGFSGKNAWISAKPILLFCNYFGFMFGSVDEVVVVSGDSRFA